MAWKMLSGVRAGTSDNLLIGPGVVYKNFVDPNNLGDMLGATTGGCKVNFDREYYNAEIDGVLGELDKAKWLVQDIPEVEVTLVEYTKDNLLTALPGSIVDSDSDPDYDIISPSEEIQVTEYTNIAVVGEITGGNVPVIFVVENALAVEPVEVDLKDGKGTVGLKVTFRGHYSEEAPTKPPYRIYLPKSSASEDTTAPVFAETYPSISDIVADGFTVNGQIDEDGTMYFVVLPDSATAPTAAQIKAGQDSTGTDVPAGYSGSVELIADVAGSATASGLTSSTAYDVYVVAEDAFGNLTSPVKLDVTTTA